jgi:hypothetical protein
MDALAFDEAKTRISVGHWTRRVVWIRQGVDSHRSALVGLRRGVNLLVSETHDPLVAQVELWAGKPEVSDGLAVIVDGDCLAGVARIPLCECGERGCGNVHTQLACQVPAGSVGVLVNIIEGLPDLAVDPHKSDTWDGELDGTDPVLG